MAKGKALELTIRIAGKMDKSLVQTLNSSQKRISSFSKSISTIGTVGIASMAALTTATVGALAKCTDAASEYQSQMTLVTKYVEGLADSNGKISESIARKSDGSILNGKTYAQNYDLVYDAIQNLSTEVPLTHEYLTEMTADLGQSGKAIEQIFKFDKDGNVIGGLAKDAAVMATAWDIEAKEASDYSSKWENAFNMSHEQVMTLANQINYLGANSATTAAEIAKAVNQSASLGQVAGVAPETTAALADAMLATGVAADSVGTSVKRMYLNLSHGENMTKKQKAILSEFGMSAEQVAKGLRSDGVGTLGKIFDGIANLPDYRRLDAVGQLFGIWASEGGAKIVGNLDVYQRALDMVSNSDLWSEKRDANGNIIQKSSMQREFDIMVDNDPKAQKQLRENALKNLREDLGKQFVPLNISVNKGLKNLFIDLDKNVPQSQELSGTLADLATKGIGKLSDAIQNALPYITKLVDYVNKNGDAVVSGIGKVGAAFVAMKFAPTIEGAIGGGADLLLGDKLAFGGRSGGLIDSVINTPDNISDFLLGKKTRKGGRKGGILRNIASAGRNAKNGIGGYFSSVKSNVGKIRPNTGIHGIVNDAVQSFWNTVELNSRGNETTLPAVLNGTKNELSAPLRFIGGNNRRRASAPSLSILQRILGGLFGQNNIIAPLLGAGGSILKNLNVDGAASGIAGLMSPLSGALTGIVTHAAPVMLALSGIIALAGILGDHFDDIGVIVEKVFGKRGLQVFELFRGKLETVKTFVSGLFQDGGVANALSPVQNAITNMFGQDAGNAFGGLTTILQSGMGVLQQIVTFSMTYVKPAIETIFTFTTQTVIPIILNAFTAAAPTIGSIITNVGSIIMTVFTTAAQVIGALSPVIGAIVTLLLEFGSFVIPAVLGAFDGFTSTILQVVQGIQGVFSGLIEFVTGVFTANWQQAWDGIKSIFGNAFDALVGLAKAPLNAIIGIVNGLFSRIGSIKIPDWVPKSLGGGKTFSLPKLSYLAKGGFTNGPSIAGEAGMEAVISFQRSSRRENLAIWEKAGQMLGANRNELLTLDTSGGRRSASFGNFVFSPQVTIYGNASRQDIDDALSAKQAEFEAQMEEFIKNKLRTKF